MGKSEPSKMKIDEKEKKNCEELDEIQLRSSNWKAAFRGGSSPMLACLPKAASIIAAYSIAPMSPGRDYVSRPNRSCVLRHQVSIIPKEAMETKKDDGFEPEEPTSPKVSCIGQVKKKKQVREEKHRRRKDQNHNRGRDRDRDLPPLPSRPAEVKMSKLKRFFSRKNLTEPVFCEPEEVEEEKDYPKLGRMKRFASGRECEALSNAYRDSMTLVDRCSETNDAKVSPLVFYSGPLTIETADREPKSEVNLWKRRSVPPPLALNIHDSCGLEIRLPSTR